MLPYWRVQDVQFQVDESQWKSTGLFRQCTWINTGHYDCYRIRNFLFSEDRQVDLAVCFMAMISVIIWFVNLLCTIPALSCTIFIVQYRQYSKEAFVCWSSIIFGLCAFLNIASASLHAAVTVADYEKSAGYQFRFKWGCSIYLAWLSGLGMLLFSVLQFTASHKSKFDETERGSTLIVHSASTKHKYGTENKSFPARNPSGFI
ncbi:unnamed protein product [Oikopleura dioica]|nr:unnamed protein product [Oikopleura dioica]